MAHSLIASHLLDLSCRVIILELFSAHSPQISIWTWLLGTASCLQKQKSNTDAEGRYRRSEIGIMWVIYYWIEFYYYLFRWRIKLYCFPSSSGNELCFSVQFVLSWICRDWSKTCLAIDCLSYWITGDLSELQVNGNTHNIRQRC